MPAFPGGMEFRPGRPIRLRPPPETLPARTMHLCCPGRPEVIAGQVVRQVQVLLEHASHACHVSPVTGTVREVRPLGSPDASGGASGGGPCSYEVTIDPSGDTVPTTVPVRAPEGRKLDNWFATMRQTGPWGDRDGNVGLMAQLEAARTQKPDTVVCVGLDPFPPYPDRSSLLVSFPDDAVLGTMIVADIVGATNTIMLAGDTTATRGRLRPSCRNYRVELRGVHNAYPASDPTLVAWVHAPQRRRLAHGANPVSVGMVMITPWTAIRIARWFTLGRLDQVRPMMIAWPEPDAPLTLAYALAGQPLASLNPRLAEMLKAEASRGRVLFGDPMTGRGVWGLGSGVWGKKSENTKSPDSAPQTPDPRPQTLVPTVPHDDLLITALPPMTAHEAEPCISCGWCADVCPTALRPIHLARLAQTHRKDHHLAEQLDWCIQCGLCSHICPVSIPIAQTLRVAKAEMGK